MSAINSTHDPALRSWVESANRAEADFPIQNLPFGVFRRAGGGREERYRGGVAIGDQILDMGAADLRNLSASWPTAGTRNGRTPSGRAVTEALVACGEPTLNSFLALGREVWSALRGFL